MTDTHETSRPRTMIFTTSFLSIVLLAACGGDAVADADADNSASSSTSSGGSVAANATEICAAACATLVDCNFQSTVDACASPCEADLASCDMDQLTTIAACIDDFTDCSGAATAQACVIAPGCADGF